ncbi:MAG: hypothetical protein HY080_12555 [Gammaproteobacteria bacterium]|nr:hypothetical protein [Gammaproteobacteria bacterium]
MYFIYLTLTLALLMLNLAGLTLLTRRFVPSLALARAVGIIGFCLLMFFIEHFIGLGRLNWVWPITTLLSAYLLLQQRAELRVGGFWKTELIFYGLFIYIFAWRFCFPSIYPSSEHVTDLYFIANYFDGTTLPPLDHWYPPHRFNIYYAFQHYAAALMGRIFALDPGTTYNIAFALILALPAALAWEFTGHYLKAIWIRAVLLVALVSGGTGMTPLLFFVQPLAPNLNTHQLAGALSERIVTGQRFIGLMDQRTTAPIGLALFPRFNPADKPNPSFEPLELPEETYGYQIFLGDYHPPSGGFFLLLLALALIAAIENQRIGRIGQPLLAATLPVLMVTNTWVLPLQGILIGAWLAYRYWQKNPPDWIGLVAGGSVALVLVYPFLSGFVTNVQTTSIRFVTMINHTPLSRFIGMHWPLLLLVLFGLLNPQQRRFSISLAIVFAALLLISEFVYVDDPSGGKYERTNTTMKWWGWIWTGGLISLGTLGSSSRVRWIRWGTIAIVLLISTAVLDLSRYFVLMDKNDMGYLAGHHWLTQDPTQAALVNFLQTEPNGIVLENQYGDSYDNTTLYALFSGKPALMGWPAHLITWRRNVIDVYPMKERIQTFYAGNLADSLAWLQANHVRYIVWSPDDNKDPQAFVRVQQQISNGYHWQVFYDTGTYRVGVWIANQPTS